MGAHGEHDGDRGLDLDGSGAEPLTSEDPRQIGPYPLVGLLGAGGMGRVYLGVAEGRYAAVKRVLPLLAQDPDFLRHFKHELDNLARLPAGVSVPLLATDRTANPPWFATEYIPGLTLTEAVHLNGGPLPRAALWYLLRELASRLKALHALDMLHRDVKPSNVMLTLDGLALIDFGIARAADQSRLTRTGMVLGTPEYMAPEQAEATGSLTGAADVFALGSLLFFAATGASPFGKGSGLEVLYRIVHNTPDFSALRALNPELADVVAECLEKSPAARPTAADLLDRVTAGPAPAAAPAWPVAVTEPLERRAAFAAAVPSVSELTAATKDLGIKPAANAVGTVLAAQPAAGAPAVPEASPTAASEAARASLAAGAPAVPEVAAVTSGSGSGGRTPEARKRRTRVLAVVLPVVVAAGGVSAITLLPHTSTPQAGGTPSSSASASLSASPSAGRSGPTSSARPSGSTASKSASASGHTSAGASGGDAKSGSGKGTSGTGTGGGSAGGQSGSRGGGTGSGSGTTGGGSSSGGTSTGTGTIGTAGTYRISDAADGGCLEQDTSSGGPSAYAVSGSCGSEYSPYFEWTFSPGPNGTFKVVNKGTGDCLTAFMANGWINMDACGSTSGQYWRIGARKSSGSTLESTTYWQCMQMSSSARVVPCDSTDGTQLWKDAGKG